MVKWRFIICLVSFSVGLYSQVWALHLATVRLKKITVISDQSNDTVVILHIVFPKTDELHEKFRTMSSAAYFEQYKTLTDTYPDGFEVVEIPAVPGTSNVVPIKLGDFKSKSAIVFARSETTGDHRQEIKKGLNKATITVKRQSFVLS
ncbi:MAG: hypothetical protein LBJ89_01430 [Holosporales bacterium]|jgi:hypothetical protein|nr:hypothetical protein [Holosporales bacterium]